MQMEVITLDKSCTEEGLLSSWFRRYLWSFGCPIKKKSKNPQTHPDVPLFSPTLFWQRLPGPTALDVLAVPIVIVGDAQGLLLTGLPEVPAEL